MKGIPALNKSVLTCSKTVDRLYQKDLSPTVQASHWRLSLFELMQTLSVNYHSQNLASTCPSVLKLRHEKNYVACWKQFTHSSVFS
jgi:hypothetical protein